MTTPNSKFSTFKPVLPLQIKSSNVLSQDVIMTATIPVDSTSLAPVAVFTNPSSGGISGNTQVEALAIVNHGAGKQLCHIARDQATGGGWRAIELFGGLAAEQVAAGVAYSGDAHSAVYALFIEGGKLSSTSLTPDGTKWTLPVEVLGDIPSNPRVAYSPAGRIVVYGANATGNLVTVYQAQIGGPFQTAVCKVDGALSGGDFQLCMTDENTFHILVNVGGTAYQVTGTLDGSESDSLNPVPNFKEKLKQVVLGYWNPAKLALTYLLVEDDGSLHSWTEGSATSQKIPGSDVTQANGHISLDRDGNPLLNVYVIDKQQRLSVLHQSIRNSWNDDGSPRWAPLLPLHGSIAHVASDMNPAAAPSLFTLAAGDYSLRLHAQHAGSRLWTCQDVLQHKAEAYEVVRYRTEIRVLDGNGRVLPNYPVKLAIEKGCSSISVAVAGRLHDLDEMGAAMNTDASGKLSVAILATGGLVCPNLVLSCDGLTTPVEDRTVVPSLGIHDYLSGKGPLNPTNPGGPLATFDLSGNTLAKATVGGKLLAPGASDAKLAAVAASAIQHGALVALGKKTAGVHGFGGSLHRSSPSFEVFPTQAALHAHLDTHQLARVDGFWDDLWDFFGDIFEGIKNAVIEIVHFVVDVVRSVVSLTLNIAKSIAKALDLPIDGIEKASNFMNGVFNSVDAGIDKVADWLKALFDFKAIWNTKMAIQQGLQDFPPYMIKIAAQTQGLADDWFAQQKQNVIEALDAMKEKYANQSFGQLPNWQNPSAPLSNTPFAGAAAPSDFTDNPHHNWLHDKVSSYAPDTSGQTLDESIDALWKTVEGHLQDSGTEFRAALEDFKKAVWITVKDPSAFSAMAIPALIDMTRDLALAMLDLFDALFDALVALIATGFNELDKVFRAELPLGFLNTLWAWMAKRAGHPEDDKLNLYSLGALMAALPTTLIYKLAIGVDHEPFPEGKLPIPHTNAMATQDAFRMPWQSILTSDIIRMVQVIPAGAADVLASKCPGWLSGVNVVFSGAVWVLRHGYPEKWKDLTVAAALSGPPLVCSLPSAITKWRSLHTDDANDIIATLSTVCGMGSLGYGIYMDCHNDELHQKPGMQIANILTPLPMVFSWLTLSSIRLNAELAPFAIAGNLVFDSVGYVGGGLELMLDTLQSRPKTALN
jgi:hypothetical protein